MDDSPISPPKPNRDPVPPAAAPRQEVPARAPRRLPVAPAWDLVIFGLALLAGLTALLALPLFPSQVQIAVGQPAQETYLAPRSFKYESQVLITQDRATAEADPTNLVYEYNDAVVKSQRVKLINTLSSIRDIRGVENTPSDPKRERLLALPDLNLSIGEANILLNLSSEEYTRLLSEVLETYDLLMGSGHIRDSQQLEVTRADLVRQFSTNLLPSSRQLAARILGAYLAVNMRLNTTQTEDAKAKAAANVPPHTVDVQKGEAILRVGQIADALAIEKLEKAGLRNRDVSPPVLIASAGLIALLVLLLAIYLLRFQPAVWHSRKQLVLLGLMILAPMAAARILVPGHSLLPYLLPLATVSMLIAVLLDANLAMLVTVLISLLISLLSAGSVELPIYYLVSGMIGIFALWRAERAHTFILAGAYVAAGAFAAAVIMRVIGGGTFDQSALMQMLGTALVNGGLSASLAFAAVSVLGSLFGLTTVLQLLELAHPTQPLLRRLMHEAPGTYHHSLVVSNLAEGAAELVGADPLLARVAAYYHDIGKVLNPQVFIDNQAGLANVHDTLDPFTSARLIREHVTEGIKLAHRYRLPHRVADAIPQHHGTGLIKYFYHKALAQDPNTPEAQFRYPGPRPRTKENAILMLADSVEATVRSLSQSGQLNNRGAEDCRNPDKAGENSIPDVVRRVIRERLQDGQLDESDLTVRDLARIQEAFCAMLVGIYHPRIVYPERPTPPGGVPVASAAPVAVLPPTGAVITPDGDEAIILDVTLDHPPNGLHTNGAGTAVDGTGADVGAEHERQSPPS